MQRKYIVKLTLSTILQQMVGNSKCW